MLTVLLPGRIQDGGRRDDGGNFTSGKRCWIPRIHPPALGRQGGTWHDHALQSTTTVYFGTVAMLCPQYCHLSQRLGKKVTLRFCLDAPHFPAGGTLVDP